MKRSALLIYLVSFMMCLTMAIHGKAEKSTSSAIEIDGSPVIDNQQPMIGLLELPSVFGVADPNGPPGSTLPFHKKPIKVYTAPGMNAIVMKLVEHRNDLELEEHDCEVFSAVTYRQKAGWYLIGIKNNKLTKGWVSPDDAGKFRPYEELMVNTLTYVTDEWDGVIWQAPEIKRNSKSIIKLSPRDVRVIDVKRINHQLWLRIELLNPGWCTLEGPEVIAKGWIPAFSSKGYPNIWFYARGC